MADGVAPVLSEDVGELVNVGLAVRDGLTLAVGVPLWVRERLGTVGVAEADDDSLGGGT